MKYIKGIICKRFGHAFIPASIRDNCQLVRCPRCDTRMPVGQYEKERYG